jgi:hypothetical protein
MTTTPETARTTGRRGRRGRPELRPTPRTGSFAPLRPAPIPQPRGGTQEALFGPVPTPTPEDGAGRRAEHMAADKDLIAAVIRLARGPGYLLVGPSERVMRRDDQHRDGATPVPTYEADTVAHLLDSGHLTLGAPYPGTVHGHTRTACTVLVADRARRLLDRWTYTGVVPHADPGGEW